MFTCWWFIFTILTRPESTPVQAYLLFFIDISLPIFTTVGGTADRVAKLDCDLLTYWLIVFTIMLTAESISCVSFSVDVFCPFSWCSWHCFSGSTTVFSSFCSSSCSDIIAKDALCSWIGIGICKHSPQSYCIQYFNLDSIWLLYHVFCGQNMCHHAWAWIWCREMLRVIQHVHGELSWHWNIMVQIIHCHQGIHVPCLLEWNDELGKNRLCYCSLQFFSYTNRIKKIIHQWYLPGVF